MNEQPASVTRTCPICALPLPGDAHPNTKYCDAGCRYQAEYNKRVAGRAPLLRDCAWCGVTFDARPPTGGPPMKFCTTACRLRAKNKRRAELRKQTQAERDCRDCGTPIGRTQALRCSECRKERERALRRKGKRKHSTAVTSARKPARSYDPREHDRTRRVTRADIDKWITSTGGERLPADPMEALKVVLAENDDFREAFADVHGI